jgi:hypothetical protein
VPVPDARPPGRPDALAAYLDALGAALASLPAEERREILLETRSHVAERRARRRHANDVDACGPEGEVDSVLAELGPPEAYAARFLAEPAPAGPPDAAAAASTPAPGQADVVARLARAHSAGWRAAPMLAAVALVYAVAAVWLIIAVAKPFAPETTGLFVEPDGRGGINVDFVFNSAPHRGRREVLGWWLLPLAPVVAYAAHRGAGALLGRVGRRSPPSRLHP